MTIVSAISQVLFCAGILEIENPCRGGCAWMHPHTCISIDGCTFLCGSIISSVQKLGGLARNYKGDKEELACPTYSQWPIISPRLVSYSAPPSCKNQYLYALSVLGSALQNNNYLTQDSLLNAEPQSTHQLRAEADYIRDKCLLFNTNILSP